MEAEPVGPQLGEDAEFQALGKTWKMGRLTVEIWDQLLTWAKPRINNPLEYLRCIVKDLPPEVVMPLVREKLDQCPPILTAIHPLFLQCVQETPEGQVEQFYLLLKTHHPDIDKDTAFRILAEIGRKKQEQLLLKVAGQNRPEGKKNPGSEGDDVAGDPSEAGRAQLVA